MSDESYSTAKVVGRNLLRLLADRHMPQAELARRIGADPSTVGQYVKGKINIGVTTLDKITEVLDCDLADLIGVDEAVA